MPTLSELQGDTSCPDYVSRFRDHGFAWHRHAVLFLDLLGQTDSLGPWVNLPEDGAVSNLCIKELSDAATKVVGWRQNLIEFIHGLMNNPVDLGDLPKNVSMDEYRFALDVVEWTRRTRLNVQYFGDTIVIYAPIAGPGGHINPRSVYSLLIAGSWAILNSLASRIPLRGGFDIGLAVQLGENDLYGPAFAHAYNLESRCAKEPRLAVSENIEKYIAVCRSMTTGNPIERAIGEMGLWCENILYRATDGQLCAELCSDANQVVFKSKQIFEQTIREALEFSIRSKERFRVGAHKNDELADRYQRVHDYLQNRLAKIDRQAN